MGRLFPWVERGGAQVTPHRCDDLLQNPAALQQQLHPAAVCEWVCVCEGICCSVPLSMCLSTAPRISIYLAPFPSFIYLFIRGSFFKLISLFPGENCNCVLGDEGIVEGRDGGARIWDASRNVSTENGVRFWKTVIDMKKYDKKISFLLTMKVSRACTHSQTFLCISTTQKEVPKKKMVLFQFWSRILLLFYNP